MSLPQPPKPDPAVLRAAVAADHMIARQINTHEAAEDRRQGDIRNKMAIARQRVKDKRAICAQLQNDITLDLRYLRRLKRRYPRRKMSRHKRQVIQNRTKIICLRFRRAHFRKWEAEYYKDALISIKQGAGVRNSAGQELPPSYPNHEGTIPNEQGTGTN